MNDASWYPDYRAWLEELRDSYTVGETAPCVALLNKVLTQLDQARAEAGEVALTLAQAQAEGGYSYDHLQRGVANDTIPNAGKPGAPLILRKNVPVKPAGHARASTKGHTAYSVPNDVRGIESRISAPHPTGPGRRNGDG